MKPCPDCVLTPSFDTTFASAITGVCSGRCGREFGPPLWWSKPPPEPDFFEKVVGVPLDEWLAADTLEKFAELLEERDHPEA